MCLWELVHNAGEAVPLCPMMWSDVAGPAFGAKKKKKKDVEKWGKRTHCHLQGWAESQVITTEQQPPA